MRNLLLALTLLPALFARAQKFEEALNYLFKPTNFGPRYYAVTEKKDTLWHRQAWYLPERTMALDGWYKDRECQFAHGTVKMFHPNRRPMSAGTYVDGLRQGTWLAYDTTGRLRDSATYGAGRVRGIRLQWHDNGMLADSIQMDETGNGVEVQWDRDGAPTAAGLWTQDTLKRGRWQYFHPNGQIKSTEDYTNGTLVYSKCYDSTGKQVPNCNDREVAFPGGPEGWRKYLERNLNASTPVDRGARSGSYTVVVQYFVNADGSVEDVKALTHHGYGMEEEVVRLLKNGPRWLPAIQYGQPVKALRKQPVTFVVEQE